MAVSLISMLTAIPAETAQTDLAATAIVATGGKGGEGSAADPQALFAALIARVGNANAPTALTKAATLPLATAQSGQEFPVQPELEVAWLQTTGEEVVAQPLPAIDAVEQVDVAAVAVITPHEQEVALPQETWVEDDGVLPAVPVAQSPEEGEVPLVPTEVPMVMVDEEAPQSDDPVVVVVQTAQAAQQQAVAASSSQETVDPAAQAFLKAVDVVRGKAIDESRREHKVSAKELHEGTHDAEGDEASVAAVDKKVPVQQEVVITVVDPSAVVQTGLLVPDKFTDDAQQVRPVLDLAQRARATALAQAKAPKLLETQEGSAQVDVALQQMKAVDVSSVLPAAMPVVVATPSQVNDATLPSVDESVASVTAFDPRAAASRAKGRLDERAVPTALDAQSVAVEDGIEGADVALKADLRKADLQRGRVLQEASQQRAQHVVVAAQQRMDGVQHVQALASDASFVEAVAVQNTSETDPAADAIEDVAVSVDGLAIGGDATQRAQDLRESRAAMPIQIRTQNMAHASVFEQVQVQVQQAVRSDGSLEDTIQVKLQPIELGAVSITLKVQKDGSTHVRIEAQREETMQMLQRDARGLAAALAEAGLQADSGNLEFSMGGEGRSGGEAQAQRDAELALDGVAAGGASAVDAGADLSQATGTASHDSEQARVISSQNYTLGVRDGVDIEA